MVKDIHHLRQGLRGGEKHKPSAWRAKPAWCARLASNFALAADAMIRMKTTWPTSSGLCDTEKRRRPALFLTSQGTTATTVITKASQPTGTITWQVIGHGDSHARCKPSFQLLCLWRRACLNWNLKAKAKFRALLSKPAREKGVCQSLQYAYYSFQTPPRLKGSEILLVISKLRKQNFSWTGLPHACKELHS